MARTSCGSESQGMLSSRLALSFPGINGMLTSPLLRSDRKTPVCSERPFLDLRLPLSEVEQLGHGQVFLEAQKKPAIAQLQLPEGREPWGERFYFENGAVGVAEQKGRA
jgi:hypothetical protein